MKKYLVAFLVFLCFFLVVALMMAGIVFLFDHPLLARGAGILFVFAVFYAACLSVVEKFMERGP